MPSTIGSRIRRLRKEAGMTLDDLAAKTKIDSSQISKMENSAHDLPSVERVRKIARALNVMPDDIILGEADSIHEKNRIAVMSRGAR